MNTSTTFSAILIALCYVLWPTAGKAANVPPMWLGTIVCFISFVCMMALGGTQLKDGPSPSTKALIVTIVVGILNGVAVWAYSYKTTSKDVPTGAFIVLMSISIIVIAPFLDHFLNGSTLTMRKCAGATLGIIAIWLVNGK
jgi:drug/metabolite transporter (DMT)-like permease